MGYYNVIRPCVVGNLHYVRPTPYFSPIEVDDEVAAPLVESGDLTVYNLTAYTAPKLGLGLVEAFGNPICVDQPSVEDFAYGGPAAEPKPRTRRRKASED